MKRFLPSLVMTVLWAGTVHSQPPGPWSAMRPGAAPDRPPPAAAAAVRGRLAQRPPQAETEGRPESGPASDPQGEPEKRIEVEPKGAAGAAPGSAPDGTPEAKPDGDAGGKPKGKAAGGEGEDSPIAFEFDARVDAGYDSNPLKLARNVEVGYFGRLRGDLGVVYRSHRKKLDVYLRGGFGATKFFESSNDGDRDEAEVTLGMTDRSVVLASGPLRFDFGLGYGYRDTTFVDNATGVEAVSGGRSISDRFDSSWYDAFLKYDVPVAGSTSLLFDLTFRIENYRKDFSAIGLRKLDYREYGFQTGVRQKLADKVALDLLARYAVRYFDDRRADDLAGNPIAGTDLKFRYYVAKAGLTLTPTKQVSVELGAEYNRRNDNETGFNDRTLIVGSGRIAARSAEGSEFSVAGDWSYREFDHITAGAVNEDNEGGRRKEGYRFWVTYSIPASIMGELFLRFRREVFTNTDLDFEYKRYVASAGFRLKL